MMMALGRMPSARQQALLGWIAIERGLRGYPPSIRELQARLAYRSINTIVWHLRQLKAAGYVTWDIGLERRAQPRTLALTKLGRTMLETWPHVLLERVDTVAA